jgi:tetratricopeptide (TPR) repeat protein
MGSRVVPTPAYHAAFSDFYDGDYKTALDRFRTESRGAIKTSVSRWIDSICYETMIGECNFHMGLYDEALTHYTSALELYLNTPTWMVTVNFPASVRAEQGLRRTPPWAVRRMQAALGVYPTTVLIRQGNVTVGQLQPGTTPMPMATQYPIEPAEIVRCTCLAMRRRAQLLGPLAAHDEVFDRMITALSQRPGPPNHWSQAWINLEYGLALSCAGRDAQALPILQSSTLAAGEFVHPLSSIAHLALGRLAMSRADYVTAAQQLEEASYAAFYYSDPGVLEDAFRLGALNHLLANSRGMFAPLANAGAWAKTNRLRSLYAAILMASGENHIALTETRAALELLEEARQAMGQRPLANGRAGAQRNFLHATALYQARKMVEGDAAMGHAMTFMRQTGSLWLFQIRKVDSYYGGSSGAAAAARTAIDLYQLVLRDPQRADWLTDPMESLAVLMSPHPLVYEHWFEATLARKDIEMAVEVADRTKRHRFLTTLPMGGRLEALRWVLEAPKANLPQEAVLQRQEIFTRYPEYKQLSDQLQQVRDELAKMPLVIADPQQAKRQSQLLSDMAGLGLRQELVMREIGLRRDPALIAFPPLRTTADIQRSLPGGHALLIFFATSSNYYGFLYDKARYSNWQVADGAAVIQKRTASLLRELGNFSKDHELAMKDLADVKWKTEARDLLDGLLKGSKADFSTKFDELIVVPDGLLWYVPFEALEVSVGGQLRPLISRVKIRYTPTAGLAMATSSIGRRPGNTAVVCGKLFPKLEEEATTAAFDELSKQLTNCVQLKSPLPAPAAIYANLIDRLVVLDDLGTMAETEPYAWAPLAVDHGKGNSPLSDWMTQPRRGPQEMVLPGFHTASEAPLKRGESIHRTARAAANDVLVGSNYAGNEMFLSLCGLMSTGTRTILISRWRTGGQTSLDLTREFTQELPHTSPPDAWQRAVQVVSEERVNFETEPRIKHNGSEEAPRASHPFFWAGYMLVDSGSPPVEQAVKK